MKKLNSFLFYALVTPAIALSTGSLMAQTSSAQDTTRQQQSSDLNKDGQKSSLSDRNSQGQDSGQTGSMTGTAGADVGQSRSMTRADGNVTSSQNRGHISSAPANGTQASDLIGAKVRTNTDDNIGSVKELIIDDKGQIVAILVGVGGFLGMGEKDVAIGWDNITLSGDTEDKDLRVDVTSDDLRSATAFEKR